MSGVAQRGGGEAADRAEAVRSMFDRIAPSYDHLNRVMTFGLDRSWRRRSVEELGLAQGSVVLDVACGTGDFCGILRATGMRAVGLDISAGMLAAARELCLLRADATAVPIGAASVDGATCGFALRNVVDVPSLLLELGRVVRPGGRIALLEVDEPRWQPARLLHGLYFRRVVPVLGSLLSERDAYEYLPRSVEFLPDHAELTAMMKRAGFGAILKRRLSAGAVQLVTATRGAGDAM